MVVVWKKRSADVWEEPDYGYANQIEEEHRKQEGGSADQNALHINHNHHNSSDYYPKHC